MTLPFSYIIVSLLFSNLSSYFQTLAQNLLQVNTRVFNEATRTAKQQFTSLKKERKQPKQPASAIQSYLFYIISQNAASEKCNIKIKISPVVFMGNSAEKDNYCSFIGFIVETSQMPKNASANTCGLSQPPQRIISKGCFNLLPKHKARALEAILTSRFEREIGGHFQTLAQNLL